jgi:PAS domain S-box-containing protein
VAEPVQRSPLNEAARLAALASFDILDSPREQDFDDLVILASEICQTPIAVVNFIDRGRQWFKAEVGLGVRETPLDTSFCRQAILEEDFMLIPDATKDRRFAGNPLVTDVPHLRFYAGALLKTEEGHAIGTMCVLDYKVRALTERQTDAMRRLARQVMAQLNLRRVLRQRQDSDARLQMAVEASDSISTWDWDIAGDRITGDARFARMYGINPIKASGGVPISEIYGSIPTDDAASAKHAVDQAIATGTPYGHEHRVVSTDGILRWVAVQARARYAADGKPLRFSGVTFDITERKQAADALQRLNKSLEAQVATRTEERDRIWQVSQDMLLVANAKGIWLNINPAWTWVLGWAAEELLGKSSEWLEHPEDRTNTRTEFAKLGAGQATLVFENRFRTKSGEYRTLSWTVAASEGQFYCVARDVTEQYAQLVALAETEERLRQSQKMEAVGQLTGGLAHDFNNLLTGIAGSLELLQIRIRQGRLNEVDRYIVAARAAAKRAAALTHRLLAFSRRQTLDPKPIGANSLISGMEELIRRTMGPAITVEVVGSAGLWTALVDPNQLENALLNLCINARDAMPDGGRLTIETANRWIDERAGRERELNPGQYLSLCVSDTGSGMTPEVIARAFDPFFTTKPIGMGTGLGLSMIYGFARQSGGQVRIYSEVGQGTMVCIYLPRHYGKDETAEAAPDARNVPFAEQDETVLVVDDESTVRMLMTEVLTDLHYTAVEAPDGAAALKVLQSDMRIDLLITDVGLPGGMNGRQLADAGRALRPDLKVLFVTGYAENAVVGNGHLEPGMNVLTKPFAMDELATRVSAIIAGLHGRRPDRGAIA